MVHLVPPGEESTLAVLGRHRKVAVCILYHLMFEIEMNKNILIRHFFLCGTTDIPAKSLVMRYY